MTSAKIQCPKCHRTYEVAAKILGRKVVCANKMCGTKFTAEANPPPDPAQEDVVFAMAEDSSSNGENDDSAPPPLPFIFDAIPPATVKAAEVKVNRQRMGFLTVLAAVPSVLLCVVSVLYWYDISHRRTTNEHLAITKKEGSRAPATEVIEDDAKAPATEVPEDEAKNAAFRKSVVRLLNAVHTDVLSIKKSLDVDGPYVAMSASQMYGGIFGLTAMRNHIKAPPKIQKFGEQIDRQLDTMLKNFHQATTLIQKPDGDKKFTNVVQILEELRFIDGHGVPQPVLQALGEVTQTATAIAEELGLGFDEAHGSRKFHENALDFIANVRLSIAQIKALPVEPPNTLIDTDFETVRDTDITSMWGEIPEAPEGMANREEIVSALAEIHKHAVKAARSHQFSHKYLFRKILSHDDRIVLRKVFEDASQIALKIADEIEPRIKKSRPQ